MLGYSWRIGLPDQIPILSQLTNQKYKFHNTNLSSIIEHARHATAIDETRQVFNVTPMERSHHSPTQDIYQMWFPGDHGCVGGGTEAHRGLSDAALEWMMNEANLLGLDFDETKIQGGGLYPNHRIEFEPDLSPVFMITGQINREITGSFERNIHESVKKRWRDLPNYRSQNLVQRYAQKFNTWALQNPAQILIA